MSTIVLGLKSRLTVAGVEMAGLGVGLDTLEWAQLRQAIPLGSLAAAQLTPYTNFDWRWLGQSNPTHDPALRDLFGSPVAAYAYHPAAGDGNQYTGSAVIRPTLTLDPRTDIARWSLAAAGDGAPNISASGADPRAAASATSRHRATRTTISWGATDITPAWRDALVLTGTGQPIRIETPPVAADAVVGRTADLPEAQAGYAATIGVRASDQLDAILADPSAVLTISRADAAWRYTIPMLVTGLRIVSRDRDAVTAAVTFTQGPGAATSAAIA